MLCSEAVKVNSNHTGGQVATLKCKRWSCPICHPEQRRKVIGHGRRGKPEKFMTLTSKPDRWHSPDDAARGMRDAFAKLIRKIRKDHPNRTVEYLRVFEKTKAGWPHLHILMRAPWIDQRWLSAAWQDLTGAFIVDIRAVDNVEKAVFYVTKYIGKELAKFKGVTRWFRSRKWNEPDDYEDSFVGFGSHWDTLNIAPHLAMWRFVNDALSRGSVLEKRSANYVRWRHRIEREMG